MLLNTSFRGSKITLAHSKLFKNLSFSKSLKTQNFQKVPQLSTRKKSNLWHFYKHLTGKKIFFSNFFKNCLENHSKIVTQRSLFVFKSHCESHKQNSIYGNSEWFKNPRLRRRRV